MPKTYPIQQSFSAGEISPRLLARTDQPGYKHSAQMMLNMVPTIQGPASDRAGLEHIEIAQDPSEQYCRMIPFPVSFDESYAIIITQLWIYIADRDGFQPDSNLLTNADFSDEGLGWSADAPGGSNVSFVAGICTLNSNNASQPASIWQPVNV